VRDGRHSEVRLLVYEEVAARRSGNWTMGQVGAETVDTLVLLKYFKTVKLCPFTITGKAIMAPLMELIATGVITRLTAV